MNDVALGEVRAWTAAHDWQKLEEGALVESSGGGFSAPLCSFGYAEVTGVK